MEADQPPHDLVVGGSGMLAALCERMARRGRIVSVIGRDRARLDALAAHAEIGGGHVNPIPLDYRDTAALQRGLEDARYAWGSIRRAVCWIHNEVAREAALIVGGHVTGPFWHILGSAAADPSRPEVLADWRERFRQSHPTLDYRIVALGFALSAAGGHSRWLTDEEISDGVGKALEGVVPLSIVGSIAPWSDRP